MILEFDKPTVSDVVYVEGAVGNIYLESDAEVERYKRIFSRLQSIGLDPGVSAAMVMRIVAACEDRKDRKPRHRTIRTTRSAQARGDEKEMNAGKAEKIALSAVQRVGIAWLKAQSSTDNGACVEIASPADKVAVRDSKDPDDPALLYTPAEFKVFLNGVQDE